MDEEGEGAVTDQLRQWVLHPENSLVWHREVLAWINKYTGIDKSDAEDEAPGRALEIRN